MKGRVFGVVLFALLSVFCSRPAVEETFVKAGAAPDGIYSFSVDMADTLCRYDVSFFTRFDARRNRLAEWDGVGLEVEWVSPSGVRYGEQVMMPVPLSGNFFSSQLILPYRKGLLPVEAGLWTLEVRVPSVPPGFRGLGIIIDRKDGSR